MPVCCSGPVFSRPAWSGSLASVFAVCARSAGPQFRPLAARDAAHSGNALFCRKLVPEIGQLDCRIPGRTGMFASPENMERVLTSTRERLDASCIAIQDLHESLLTTRDLIYKSRQLIARSDSLVQQTHRESNWRSGLLGDHARLSCND
jgi:hypothetical protein